MPTNAEIMEKLETICSAIGSLQRRFDAVEKRMRSVEAHLGLLSTVVRGHSVHIGESISSTPVPPMPDGDEY
jgi:hypothetical protein